MTCHICLGNRAMTTRLKDDLQMLACGMHQQYLYLSTVRFRVLAQYLCKCATVRFYRPVQIHVFSRSTGSRSRYFLYFYGSTQIAYVAAEINHPRFLPYQNRYGRILD